MKKNLLLYSLIVTGIASAQTAIQSVNCGALVTPGSSVSVGEIVVVPANPDQTASGIIGILAQSQQTLEVPELELSQSIVVYPNPTASQLYFRTEEIVAGMSVSVFNSVGQLVGKKNISADNSLSLESLPAGIYLIQPENKKINAFKIIKH